MKKILGGFLLLGGLILSQAQTIQFEQTTLDYGTVPVGADGHRVFTFKNTGDKPLILSNVAASCGCTTPEWEKNPVLPGQTGKIKVGYNTNIPGNFKKNIDIYSNDPANGRMSIYIQGIVDPNAKAADPHAGHDHAKKEEVKTTPATPATPTVEAAKPAEPKKGKAVRKKSKK